MKSKTIAVIGATGNIGRSLVPMLVERGHRVRAVGRDEAKLAELSKLGAQTYSMDFEDADGLADVLKGVDVAFAMLPPNYGSDDFSGYQERVSKALTQAIELSGLRHLVNLSSIGAHANAETGPIFGLHLHEKRLTGLADLNVVHLRPSYFMENLFWALPTIAHLGANSGSLKADVKIPMVATRDIAQKAAELLSGEIQGKTVFEFGGPEDISLDEVTSQLGKALGHADLKYVPIEYATEEKAMVGAGMKPSTVRLMVQMNRAMNEKVVAPTQTLDRSHRGTTRFAEFAKIIAQAARK